MTHTDTLSARAVSDPNWFVDASKVCTLILFMLDRCDDMDEAKAVVRQIRCEPWHWTAEYREAVRCES